MKHLRNALIAALMVMCSMVMAQTGQDFCKGLKNPTSFVVSTANNPAHGQWYGFTGSKSEATSTCDAWAMSVSNTQISAAQLSSQSSGSSCTSTNSVDINGQNDYQRRFVVKGMGSDPATSNRLSYTPPDPTFTSSIRLGNYCGGAEAEVICYQLDVRPENSLIFIWYALSLQNGQHSTAANPEFGIVIEKKVGNNWVRIGGNELCYMRPTPASPGQDVAPFYRGATGTQTNATYAENIYLPWNKVAISLNEYLYETIRIKVGAGDCSYSAHYGCAFIAGECQSMEIKTSGCPAGSTTVVDTLRAPKGMSNYTWYKSNQGSEGINSLFAVPANINFTQLNVGSADDSIYLCRIEDFRMLEGSMAGQLTNEQIFRCDMTSYMNPDYPVLSKVYVRVVNTKPIMSIDTMKYCDGTVKLINKSFVPNDIDGCDTAITTWMFYNGSDTNSDMLSTDTGSVVTHQWDTANRYAVTVRSFNADDHNCYTDNTYVIKALTNPRPIIDIDPPSRQVCVDERVQLTDATVNGTRTDWIFNDETIRGREGDPRSIFKVFNEYKNPIEMISYNGLFELDSINIYDTTWCHASILDTVTVFKDPDLIVSGDTMVCNGQQTDIHVETETPNCDYNWYLERDGNNSIALHTQDLRVLPYADTCEYWVKVISEQACVAWISVNAYRVNPRLSINRHDMCEGDYMTLEAENAYTYSWYASPADPDLDALLDSAGHGPETLTLSPKQTTTYTVVGHGTNDCNADPLSETITVHPIPVATIDYDPNFVDSDNPVVTFTDASPYSVDRQWIFEDGTPLTDVTSPCSHNFGEVSSDSVTVTLVAYNDLACSDTAIARLPVTQFTFYAPNVFTPERPDNNVFRVFTANEQENFSVYIYDRNGRQIYTSTDLHFTWDGTYNGIQCPQGTYAWVVRYRRPGTEDIVTQKGTITLIR